MLATERVAQLASLFEWEPITLTATIAADERSLVPVAHGDALSISDSQVLVRTWLGYWVFSTWRRDGGRWVVVQLAHGGPGEPRVVEAVGVWDLQLRIGAHL